MRATERGKEGWEKTANLETTQIYTHVMRRPGMGLRGPLDEMG